MPSLTVSLMYKVEFTGEELRLLLWALDNAVDAGGSDQEYRDLATKLRRQKLAFVKQMLEQVLREDEPR